MSFCDYSGQIVTLTTVDNQTYKGTVCSVDENNGKIVLKNASTNGSKLPGLQNFFVSSIRNLSLATELQVSKASDNQRKGQRSREITPLSYVHHGQKPHLRNLLKFDSDQLVRSQCLGADSGDQGIGSGDDDFEDFYEGEHYTMFCQTCDRFRDSITCLMQQSVIALKFCGTDLGRKGTLSLIQIATDEHIFLYDIQRLGEEGFVDGLQAVLESDSVLKVIHDCRMVSDMLYHQFQVSLSNVFDTQVASAFVFRSGNDGNWPRFVESLPGVLMSHLGLTNEDVHHFFVRERLKQRDEEVWLQRPVCLQLLSESFKNLIHMIPLYHVLKAKLLAEFNVGVQLYLDQVRNAPKHKVDHFSSSSHLLPFVFQDLPQLVKHYSHVRSRVRSKFVGSEGFVTASPRAGPNMVTTSRDSIWHSKSQINKTACNCKCRSKNATRPSVDANDNNVSTDSKPSCGVDIATSQKSSSISDQRTDVVGCGNCNSFTQVEKKDLKDNVQNDGFVQQDGKRDIANILQKSKFVEPNGVKNMNGNLLKDMPVEQDIEKDNIKHLKKSKPIDKDGVKDISNNIHSDKSVEQETKTDVAKSCQKGHDSSPGAIKVVKKHSRLHFLRNSIKETPKSDVKSDDIQLVPVSTSSAMKLESNCHRLPSESNPSPLRTALLRNQQGSRLRSSFSSNGPTKAATIHPNSSLSHNSESSDSSPNSSESEHTNQSQSMHASSSILLKKIKLKTDQQLRQSFPGYVTEAEQECQISGISRIKNICIENSALWKLNQSSQLSRKT